MNNDTLYGIASCAAEKLRAIGGGDCKIGLILGSGLGNYAERLSDCSTLSYGDIPGYPVSSVPGHAGQFVVGKMGGKSVIVMQGRFHYYEGYPQETLLLGVRTMKLLGVENLLLTNAAGGVNLTFEPGTLMSISDHIDFAGVNPLIGPNDDRFGVRFPDQGNIYDKDLRTKLVSVANEIGVPVREGVYMMFSGPSFETPAEIRMARVMGADAVGMSTVPEAITANHCGMKVLGISLITNMAAGVLEQKLTHEEVFETAQRASRKFEILVDEIIKQVF